MIKLLLMVIIIGGLLLLYMVREAFGNQIRRHELSFSKFPPSLGSLRIFFISDIHKRNISPKIIQEIKGNADVVVIGGDLWESGVPLDKVKGNLLKLKEIGPVYFVWGNNDYEGDVEKFKKLLDELAINIAANEAYILHSSNEESISLLGVDDLNLNKDRLDLALEGADEASFKILACHYPKIINQIRPEQQIQLVLSGHTHGGQIRIFGYGPYSKGGIKKSGNTVLLVSNGYGTTMLPLRLGAPAECHLITVKHDNGG